MYDTQEIPYVPPAPKRQKPRRHWGWWIVGAIVTLLGLIIGLGAVAMGEGATGTSQIGTINNSAPANPAPSTKAPSTPAPAPVHKLTLAEWANGPGYDEMQTVASDLEQISQDSGTYDMSAVRDDGLMLESDANAALGDPPPAPIRQDYKVAMRHFARAGSLMQEGDILDATTQIANGTEHILSATQAVQHLGS